MNKEFIPWEEALELRQLGFKEECLGVWQNLKSGKNLVVDEDYDRKFDIPVLGADIGAPLFQQSFRWFRETYNLHHVVIWDYDTKNFDAGLFGDLVTPFLEKDTIFTTYEEAELACLKKLIEIVKSNNSKK